MCPHPSDAGNSQPVPYIRAHTRDSRELSSLQKDTYIVASMSGYTHTEISENYRYCIISTNLLYTESLINNL